MMKWQGSHLTPNATLIARIDALIVPLAPTGIKGVLIAGNSIAVYFQASIWA